jgi:chlorite dismutase
MAIQQHELDEPGSIEQQNVRIDATTKRLLARLAAAKKMTLPQYCAFALMEHVGQKSDELLEIHREDAERALQYQASLKKDLQMVVQSAASTLNAASEPRRRKSRVDA